jgi:hypothetical protein
MKKVNLLLGIFLLSTLAYGHAPIENSTKSCRELSLFTEVYPAIATTRNGLMQNYSIGISIYATKTSYMKSIHKVVVDGSTVSISSVIGENDTYRFYYGNTVYYFTF